MKNGVALEAASGIFDFVKDSFSDVHLLMKHDAHVKMMKYTKNQSHMMNITRVTSDDVILVWTGCHGSRDLSNH